jgi:uncharacterized spore protein YtfJ
MTTQLSAEVAHHAAGESEAGHFLGRLADQIGGQASVRAIFGEPIEHGDLIVVPVARARWGFGGGTGSAAPTAGTTGSGSGSGGGGGVSLDPAGYLQLGASGAAFQPIASPNQVSPPFVLAAGLAIAAVLRALARLRRP